MVLDAKSGFWNLRPLRQSDKKTKKRGKNKKDKRKKTKKSKIPKKGTLEYCLGRFAHLRCFSLPVAASVGWEQQTSHSQLPGLYC